MNKANINLKKALGYVRNNNLDIKWIYFLVSVHIAKSLVSLTTPEIFRRAISIMESKDFSVLPQVIWFAIIAMIVNTFAAYLSVTLLQKTQNIYETKIQAAVFNKLFSLDKLRRSRVGSGKFINTAIENTSKSINGSLRIIANLTEGGFTVFASGIYMIILNPILATGTIVFNIIFRLLTRIFDRKIRESAKKNVVLKNRNIDFALELLKNTIIIRVFEKYSFFEKRYRDYENEEQKAAWKEFTFSNS